MRVALIYKRGGETSRPEDLFLLQNTRREGGLIYIPPRSLDDYK